MTLPCTLFAEEYAKKSTRANQLASDMEWKLQNLQGVFTLSIQEEKVGTFF